MCDWKFQPGRIVVTMAAVEVLLPADMFFNHTAGVALKNQRFLGVLHF